MMKMILMMILMMIMNKKIYAQRDINNVVVKIILDLHAVKLELNVIEIIDGILNV
jgi:hypothetical protein